MTELDRSGVRIWEGGLRIAILLHTTMLIVGGQKNSIVQFISLSMGKSKSKVLSIHAMKA